MGKPLLKAQPREPRAAPSLTVPGLTVVEKASASKTAPDASDAPAQPAAAPARARDAGIPRITTSDTWRDLHPARVWPD